MIDILFNIDDNYKVRCKTVIRSILANTKEKVQFHIFGVNNFNCDFADVKCYGKPNVSIIKAKTNFRHITTAACYRLFAPIILDKLDKIIYLDSDLIVLDDIKKIWDFDIKYIAGVKDGLFKYQARKNNLHHTYINSGVLVMNLKNLRKLDYIERIEKTQTGKYNLSLLDQDIINIAFENEIELLPNEWNVLTKLYSDTSEDMLEARKHPAIIHYAGYEKPWINYKIWGADKWFKYWKYEPIIKKAIVLTYAPVTKAEAKLLRETDTYKIATNFSAAELKPNVRLTADNIVDKCLECDTCDVISLNYDVNKDRVINGQYLPKRYTTLVSCVDYLMLQGYTHILLIATNPDSATCKMNYEGINQLKRYLYLYKYTSEGNFDIPHITVKDFIMENFITEEDKILGMAEPGKLLLDMTALTDACRYEVWTEGYDNKSIEGGNVINNLLPYNEKQKFVRGETEIKYNGMIIKRLTAVIPPKQEVKEEIIEPEEKPIKTPAKRKVAAKKKVKK